MYYCVYIYIIFKIKFVLCRSVGNTKTLTNKKTLNTNLLLSTTTFVRPTASILTRVVLFSVEMRRQDNSQATTW